MKKILKSNLLLSIGITVISILICYICFGFKVFYETNDDYGLSTIMKWGGVSDSIFLSYFLTAPLAYLQKLIPTINLFVIFQLIISFCSFILVTYIILEKFTKKYALLFILIFNILFICLHFVFVQWTQTAALGCAAGYMAIFSAFTFYKKLKYKYVPAVCGLFLIVLSAWLRIDAFLSVSAVFAVFVLSYLIVYYWKNKVENNISIKKAIKEQLFLVFSLIITVVLVLGMELVSNSLKSTTYGYDSYKSYNTARSSCLDYGIAPFEGNEEFYNSKGILSQADFDLFKDWIIDEDLFTEETLLSIREYSDTLPDSKNGIINYALLKINDFSNKIGVSPYIILGGLGLLSILASVLLFIFRNKLKFLFPTLLIGIFIFYFIVFKFLNVYILALPIFAFIVATGYFFNRYHYFYLMSVSGITLILIFYLNFSRLNFRAAYTIFITAILCLIICIDKNNIRVSICKQNRKAVKKAIICFSTIVLMLSAFYSEYIVLTDEEFIKDTVDESLYNYIESNNDELFVVLRAVVAKNYNSPLLAPEKPDNTLIQSGWTIGSPLNEQKKSEYKINRLFKDMINNKSASFVVDRSKGESLESYYNEHYADENKSINLKEQEKFGDICIYKVESE